MIGHDHPLRRRTEQARDARADRVAGVGEPRGRGARELAPGASRVRSARRSRRDVRQRGRADHDEVIALEREADRAADDDAMPCGALLERHRAQMPLRVDLVLASSTR